MDKKQEFLKKLLETFRIEAEETVKNMAAQLIELEKKQSVTRTSEIIEVIFRDAHSLKGASRAVNLLEIESVCQSFESVMSAMKNKTIELGPKVFDVLHQTVDKLDDLLQSSGGEMNKELKYQITDVLKNLSLVETGKLDEIEIVKKDLAPDIKEQGLEPEPQPKPEPAITKESVLTRKEEKQTQTKKAPAETIRVSIEKMDKLLFQGEEMLSLKMASIQRSGDLQNSLEELRILKRESNEVFSSAGNVRQAFERKERDGTLTNQEKDITKIIKFYDWANSHIKNLESDLIDLQKSSDQETYTTGSKIEALLEDVKEILTVPFSTLLDVFPRASRDLSKDVGKNVDFVVKGDDVEIDRRILEEIRNPLMHLLRNCIDYGIEKPGERRLKNKPERGTITFDIERLENNKVEILISDDGAGIDLDKVKELYIENENISNEVAEKLTYLELSSYIFKSGISTSDIVTDISGRGLGMAIVQEKIEQLGGTVTVETEKDVGTTFKIGLPLSLVTFRGVLIEVTGKQFVVPTAKVKTVLRLKTDEVKTVENKATIPIEGIVIPLVNMSDILEMPFKETDSEYIQALIFSANNKQIAFAIDQIVNELEILTKTFNKQLTRVRNITGATVLGSGKVVPILNIADIMKSALKVTGRVYKPKESDMKEEEEQKPILVVEDSITSRMLLKNILESAGYRVSTAIDGIDGFTQLKEGSFLAVVSDVEMPRMNGFDLTKKIREDEELSDMPVVLVTSLSKREDKEKGIDVGANAYIIKSSFDQSNLLEILERLI